VVLLFRWERKAVFLVIVAASITVQGDAQVNNWYLRVFSARDSTLLRSASGGSGSSKRHVTTVLRVTGLVSRPLWSILRASLPQSRPWLELAGEAPLLIYRSRSREKVCWGSLQPQDLGDAPPKQSYGGLEPICLLAPQQRCDFLQSSL
jgi:hypothetical protein